MISLCTGIVEDLRIRDFVHVILPYQPKYSFEDRGIGAQPRWSTWIGALSDERVRC